MTVISPSKGCGPLPKPAWRVSRLLNGPELKRSSSYSFLSGELAEEGPRRFKRKKTHKEDPGEEPKMTSTRKIDRTAEQKVPGPRGAKSQQTTPSFQVRSSTKRTNKYPGEADPTQDRRFRATPPPRTPPKKIPRKLDTRARRYLRTLRRKAKKSSNHQILKPALVWPGKRAGFFLGRIRKNFVVTYKSQQRKGGNWLQRARRAPRKLGERPKRARRRKCRKRLEKYATHLRKKLFREYSEKLLTVEGNLQKIRSAIWRIQAEESGRNVPERLPRKIRRGSKILSMMENPRVSEVHNRRVQTRVAWVSKKPSRDRSRKKLKKSSGLEFEGPTQVFEELILNTLAARCTGKIRKSESPLIKLIVEYGPLFTIHR